MPGPSRDNRSPNPSPEHGASHADRLAAFDKRNIQEILAKGGPASLKEAEVYIRDCEQDDDAQ